MGPIEDITTEDEYYNVVGADIGVQTEICANNGCFIMDMCGLVHESAAAATRVLQNELLQQVMATDGKLGKLDETTVMHLDEMDVTVEVSDEAGLDVRESMPGDVQELLALRLKASNLAIKIEELTFSMYEELLDEDMSSLQVELFNTIPKRMARRYLATSCSTSGDIAEHLDVRYPDECYDVVPKETDTNSVVMYLDLKTAEYGCVEMQSPEFIQDYAKYGTPTSAAVGERDTVIEDAAQPGQKRR